MALSPYLRSLMTPTPQSAPATPAQVPNSAGGYVFKADLWVRLDRFLILGADGATYYATKDQHVEKNVKVVQEAIAADGLRTVAKIVEISDAGRAPKNDPALFALALCAATGDVKTKAAALAALPKVARTGTHLFHFVTTVQSLRGWGRALKRAVARWYTERPADKLALQLAKYQSRDGIGHKDLLRLAHPVPPSLAHGAAFRYVAGNGSTALDVDGSVAVGIEVPATKKTPSHTRRAPTQRWRPIAGEHLPALLGAVEEAHQTKDVKELIALITDHGLPHECVPNEWKSDPKVWEAMLPSMGITAIVRNLGKMTSIGMLGPLSETSKFIGGKLRNVDVLRKGRVHPMALLIASGIYGQGHGDKGKLTWAPNAAVVAALDDAFHLAFQAVEPTGKNTLIALDVSGSMGTPMPGAGAITCREASAAMALVTACREPNHHLVGFTASDGRTTTWGNMRDHDRTGITPLKIHAGMRLNAAVAAISNIPFGGTDCALPMIWAAKNKVPVDTFAVYCADEKTEILTTNGWKTHDALKEGEEVYTLNHETGVGEWQKTTAVNVFPATRREMILMEGRGHSSLTTLNHRWPVRGRGNSQWSRRWKTSETLNLVDYIQCAAVDSGLPTEPRYPDSFVELVAWGWTEGSWDGSSALSICQSARANPLNCDRIRGALFDLFGVRDDESTRPRRHKGTARWVEGPVQEATGMINWRINQEGSRAFTEVMTIPEKVVSLQWLRTLTLQQLNLFIETSMIADGFIGKQRLAQKSPARSEAFAFACILTGKPVSFCEIDNAHHPGYLEIGLLQRYQFAPLQHAQNKDDRPFKVERVQHDGIVWCPTTPNGTWLARRNGSVYWTGNTDSETWHGAVHPFQALKDYRQSMGRDAKLVVVGMLANEFTIADVSDAGMLDVVGFDAAAPAVIADFARGPSASRTSSKEAVPEPD